MKTKKVTEYTKCWFCHRTAKNLLEEHRELLELTDEEEKESFKVCMVFVDLWGHSVPICTVCSGILFVKEMDFLEDALHIDNIEKIVVVQVPKSLDKAVDKAVVKGRHYTKSEFIRDAVREKLERMGVNYSVGES